MTEHYLDRLAKTIRENWDQPALTDFYLNEDGSAQDTSRGNHYTYGEMYEEILHVCEIFQSLGLQKGDHIAICGANSTHWAIAYLAIAKLQGVPVTVMHSLMPEDIAHQIDFSDVKVLFTDAEVWDELQSQSLPQIRNVIDLENWNTIRGENIEIPNRKLLIENKEVSFDHGDPAELAQICFTSGSTGNPKGVMLPFRSINANIACRIELLTVQYKHKKCTALLPFAHIYSNVIELLRPLCIGMHLFITTISFDLVRKLQCISPSYIVIVPSVLEGMISKRNQHEISLLNSEYIMNLLGGSIEEILIGGSKLSNELECFLMKLKMPLANGYGATECGPGICVAFQDTYKSGTVGKAMPTVNLKIASNGEILVKGENVMLGYYKDPEATARKIDKNGWLHTGDKGHLDEDGYLYVEGRLDEDMIVLPNGENVHPETIEEKINAISEVKESIVFVRDGHLVAMVVKLPITKDQSSMADADLRRHILRTINPELPLFCQLFDLELTDQPLARTEKQTLKRYLYK